MTKFLIKKVVATPHNLAKMCLIFKVIFHYKKLLKTLLASVLLQFYLLAEANAFYKPQTSQNKILPSVLKADNVEGDKNSNSLNATGNVEVARGSSIIHADQIFYYKNEANFKAIGNVKIKNIEIGIVKSTKAEIKEDFSSGIFSENTLVLNDGSYLSSPKIERKNPEFTSLDSSIYSICPNPEISENNDLAGKKKDMISIKSENFVIDRKEELFKIRKAIIRFYDVPFLYIPYLTAPLPSKERQSGFLHPSYSKNSRLGIGITIPYYFNIASNKELTVSPTFYLSTGQIVLDNEFHHLTSYGEYKTNFELANNQINQSVNVLNSTQNNDPYRWNLKAKGFFDFTKNTGMDFDINTTSDHAYLRDYHFDFRGYSLSKVNLDYINRRDYYSVQTLRFQEYENLTFEKTDPFILPKIDTKTQLNSFFKKDKVFISTNTTAIIRKDGLQYRRFSAIPEMVIPFNYNGNLFNLNGKFQGDFYSLENDDKYSTTKYDSTKTNYKPEVSLGWRLPLVKKTEKQTIIVEPMATLVSSSYKTNFEKLPNEDSNNNELTISNLFTSDRISGFDRNEAGTRVSYGVKSSIFNSHGEYSFVIGQSLKKSGQSQDVNIRGFNSNNKSNIVGMLYYKAQKYFNISYSFHLNESSYRNEINEVIASLNLERFSFTSNYLFLRRNNQNAEAREQLNSSVNFKINEKLSTQFTLSRNMITGRNLNRSFGILYGGCCTVFGFSVTESNPANLVAAQQSFNISLSFKNL